MYAVVRTGGKQYRVAQKDVVRVERLTAEVGSQIDLDEVLMLGSGTETTVGTPLIDGARVVAEVIDQIRGPKITVFKKKRRKNHRRLKGHRQALTVLRITDILAAGAKPKKVKTEKKPAGPIKAETKAPADEKAASEPKKSAPKRPPKPEKPTQETTQKSAPATKAAPKRTKAKDDGDKQPAVEKKPTASKKAAPQDPPGKPKAKPAKKTGGKVASDKKEKE